eukprot:NODE_7411_length_403_cov_36.302260_g5752_i0.p2 GENE.NODE_7411_length_403_cov_36.302260_g5752_i0~~NODE_7411_length_403_cov_36.302260_g5752_i0.p2  ORF type:complete len:64 (+),score=2.09 NODE_7411_length_403_cov_36.302260_g5752_i0:183-374(+)
MVPYNGGGYTCGKLSPRLLPLFFFFLFCFANSCPLLFGPCAFFFLLNINPPLDLYVSVLYLFI